VTGPPATFLQGTIHEVLRLIAAELTFLTRMDPSAAPEVNDPNLTCSPASVTKISHVCILLTRKQSLE
jgi:hypothetical protein